MTPTHLAIVERGREGLYATLRDEFERLDPEAGVQVIWDRRQGGDRRQRTQPVAIERRQRRRRGPPPLSWDGLGVVLVQASKARPDQG